MPNVELRRALELPLAILIETADIHLTEGSSSALEARDAGLRTLFYDKVGHRYFEGLPGAEGAVRLHLATPVPLLRARPPHGDDGGGLPGGGWAGKARHARCECRARQTRRRAGLVAHRRDIVAVGGANGAVSSSRSNKKPLRR